MRFIVDGIVPADSVLNTTCSDSHADMTPVAYFYTAVFLAAIVYYFEYRDTFFLRLLSRKSSDEAVPSDIATNTRKVEQHVRGKLIDSPETCWMDFANGYRDHFLQRGNNSTPNIQHCSTAANNLLPIQHQIQPETYPSLARKG